MRTDRLRSMPSRVMVIWPCTRRWVPSRAVFIMSSSSGSTSDSGWSSVSDSAWPISFSAERLRMPTLPEASTPMMPALADDSTASMKRRRLSIRLAGVDQFVALGAQLLGHLVEGFAELRQIAFRLVDGNLDMQVAGRNDVGGAHQAADRRDQPVGEIQPDQHRGHQDGQRDHREHQREGDLDAEPARLDLGVFGDAGLGLLQLADDVRIEQPRDIKEGVVERAQADDGGDVVRFRKYRDLRLVFVDIVEEVRRRRREVLPDAGLRRFQDIAILVDQHRARQVACGGVGGQQFAKRPAVLIVQRPGVGDVVGHARMSPRISCACSCI